MGCLALCGNISYQPPQGGGVPRPDIGWPGRNRGGHLPGGRNAGGGLRWHIRPGDARRCRRFTCRGRQAEAYHPRKGKLLRLMTPGS